MNTLIVNCYLGKEMPKSLVEALGKFSNCQVIHYSEISEDYVVANNVDTIVLSGSAARIVSPVQREMYRGTINLVKSTNLPIFGICFGHQLLCWAFGAEVGSISLPVLNRFEKMRIIVTDGLFSGFSSSQPVYVAESHYDYVLEESLSSAGFELLADSASCPVEAVKHKLKPVYGVQFHPERTKIKNESHDEGIQIIENFFKNAIEH